MSELSPPQFRATFPGITYQIGNMISSPAAQLLSTVAEKYPKVYRGVMRPDYAGAQAYYMTVIFLWLAIWLAIGHEEIGSRFETVARAGHEAFDKGAGPDATERGEVDRDSSLEDLDEKRAEKAEPQVEMREHVGKA